MSEQTVCSIIWIACNASFGCLVPDAQYPRSDTSHRPPGIMSHAFTFLLPCLAICCLHMALLHAMAAIF